MLLYQFGVAMTTEIHSLGVGIVEGIGEVHHAPRIGAVSQTEGVPEFMYCLLGCPVQNEGGVWGQFLPEAAERYDGCAGLWGTTAGSS